MHHPLQTVIEVAVLAAILYVIGRLALEEHRAGVARLHTHHARELDRIVTGVRAAAAIPDDQLDAIMVVHLPRSRPASTWED